MNDNELAEEIVKLAEEINEKRIKYGMRVAINEDVINMMDNLEKNDKSNIKEQEE